MRELQLIVSTEKLYEEIMKTEDIKSKVILL